MNPYAIAPFIATIAYIPLLFMTASTRPWQKKARIVLPVPSLGDVLEPGGLLLPQQHVPGTQYVFFDLIVILFSVTVVQFHCFTSSFYPPGYNRWLKFAYAPWLSSSFSYCWDS
jgi:hypothetical protein